MIPRAAFSWRPLLSPFSLALLLLAPRLALAAPPTAAEHERSRAQYDAGNESFRLGQYEKARAHYLTALQNERTFDVVCNLGRTEAMLGDDGLALRHLDECLKEYPPGDKVAAAREKFFELREQVRARCLKKDCAPPLAAAPDQQPEPEPTPVAEPAAFEPAAPEPAAPEPMPAPEPEGSSARIPVSLGLAVAGAIGLGVGVAYLVDSDQQASEAVKSREAIENGGGNCVDASNPGCTEFLGQVGAAQDAHTISIAGFAAGGALLGAALLTYILWPESEPVSAASADSAPRHSPPRPQLHPQFALSPDGKSGHLGLWGTF